MNIKHHSDGVIASRHLVLRAEIDRLQWHYSRDADDTCTGGSVSRNAFMAHEANILRSMLGD